ncbi:MAG: hypothetical protein ACP5NF_10775 [Thermoanaerobaculum sp.]
MPLAVDTFAIYQELVPLFGEEAAKALTTVLSRIVADIAQTVTKEEFQELRAVVAELAETQKRTEKEIRALNEAQKRTEEQVQKLTTRVDELAEAQKRTEEQVQKLTLRVDELAEAQKRTEEQVQKLTLRVDELAEAQKRTEKQVQKLTARVDELAEAQRRTQEEVRALSEAQKRTEQEVANLARGLRLTRKMVGGLSDTVGYVLEDRAIRGLPAILKDRLAITLTEPLRRGFVLGKNGEELELNIFGYGTRADGTPVTIVGEGKSRPGLRDLQKFRRLLEELKESHAVRGELLGVLVAYLVRPAVAAEAAAAGIEVVPSYELPLA